MLGHGVLVIGCSMQGGMPSSWLIKNSWVCPCGPFFVHKNECQLGADQLPIAHWPSTAAALAKAAAAEVRSHSALLGS